jgi:2-keto-4-pentenoate hydratase
MAPGDRGHAANVLDGPLSALRHLVGLFARDPVNSHLAPGDIVTTGWHGPAAAAYASKGQTQVA